MKATRALSYGNPLARRFQGLNKPTVRACWAFTTASVRDANFCFRFGMNSLHWQFNSMPLTLAKGFLILKRHHLLNATWKKQRLMD